ncbi:carbon storage regulator [Helicobacter cappadocius]|uniref:Translational regulator CsrA n=1 Tax=Helicobacter cappadocius TaxID=3063998 RepID=A0AA90PWF9_9HELI|nr:MULTISPECIES: carbon storage regulator [unclassified Helicobacter]MDO7253632.1 carbon storage regulator [Helicobacter sp. faydin-H75]MDP2539560.1 carbon storage regulator [Helicobacter sp. faydin-H76]
MLILSRKPDESIVIGDNIAIKIISIDRGSVKLGFEAPPNTLILRSELKEAVASENKKASVDITDEALNNIGKHIKH